MRVAIVEDQPLFRGLLHSVLAQQAQIDVIGAAGSVQEARGLLRPGLADAVLLDIQLPDGSGVELGLALREHDPALGIVLLSSHDVMDMLLALPPPARAGWSYLSKTSTTSLHTVLRALRTSAAGGTMLDPELVQRTRPREGSRLGTLSERQLAALRLLAEGWSNAAIAERLHITPHSVDNLLGGLYGALGAESGKNPRVAAVLTFLEETSRIPDAVAR